MERESAQATDTILDSDGLEDHGHTLPPVLPAPSHHFIPRTQPLLLHPIIRFQAPATEQGSHTQTDPRHRYRPHHPTHVHQLAYGVKGHGPSTRVLTCWQYTH